MKPDRLNFSSRLDPWATAVTTAAAVAAAAAAVPMDHFKSSESTVPCATHVSCMRKEHRNRHDASCPQPVACGIVSPSKLLVS